MYYTSYFLLYACTYAISLFRQNRHIPYYWELVKLKFYTSFVSTKLSLTSRTNGIQLHKGRRFPSQMYLISQTSFWCTSGSAKYKGKSIRHALKICTTDRWLSATWSSRITCCKKSCRIIQTQRRSSLSIRKATKIVFLTSNWPTLRP